MDAVTLEIFKSLFASVAEEMGAVLGRTAFSPNIKERHDFSCALFDGGGRMVAQAAHLPVHLGSMPASVAAAIANVDLQPGDVAVLNDPYLGGTHLPDVTIVMPVHVDLGGRPTLVGYVANRAHHADIGGASPGSMPLATELFQEGFIIPPLKLVEAGRTDERVMALICRNVRTPVERRGDLAAQLSSASVGARRLVGIVEKYGPEEVRDHIQGLLDYSETLTRDALRRIPAGSYTFEDSLDGDGLSEAPVTIRVEVTIDDGTMVADFTGSAPEQQGPINAVQAVTDSAVLYVVRCIAGEAVPANHGCMVPVRVVAPEGSVVNARPPRAVSAGNVETSQRMVDVLLGEPGHHEQPGLRRLRACPPPQLRLLRDDCRGHGRAARGAGPFGGSEPHDEHHEHADRGPRVRDAAACPRVQHPSGLRRQGPSAGRRRRAAQHRVPR